jgi:hypothetical protein
VGREKDLAGQMVPLFIARASLNVPGALAGPFVSGLTFRREGIDRALKSNEQQPRGIGGLRLLVGSIEGQTAEPGAEVISATIA